MSVGFQSSIANTEIDMSGFGPRMEAATEALLRVRNEVVSTIDQQVVELKRIHQALAAAPPPMVVVEDALPINPSSRLLWSGPGLFENEPMMTQQQGPRSTHQISSFETTRQTVDVATLMVKEPRTSMREATLDPALEQATLEELNDALASAFAMMSSRSSQ